MQRRWQRLETSFNKLGIARWRELGLAQKLQRYMQHLLSKRVRRMDRQMTFQYDWQLSLRDKECMEYSFFACLETHLRVSISQKIYFTHWHSLIMQTKQKWKFWKSPVFCLAIRLGCASCRALKITQNNRLLIWIYKTFAPKTIFLLHHFILPFKR